MPKFFVISDIHGFYTEMKEALDKAGFDCNNEEHWLVSCGDEWDRGPDPIGVMKYLNSLERKIIIRGNHTILFEDLCYRCYPGWHDKGNGTLDTVKKIGNYNLDKQFDLCCERALSRTKVYRRNMVNYFETKNHIFVHSWIPLKDNWRESHMTEWDDASWCNPYAMVNKGFLPDKTIVFGHWHCSTGWAQAEGRSEFGNDAKFDPYYGDGFISIDACCAHSGRLNVIVLEDEFLEG